MPGSAGEPRLCDRQIRPIRSLALSNQRRAPPAWPVARARGMAESARSTGLGCESLYKAMSSDGNPSFRTVLGVATALGSRFTVRAVT